MRTIVTIFKAILIVIISIIFASIFGVIHNQISYSISPEFFQNFLFGNFGTNEWNINNYRIEASIVGILGSYWVGFILGIIYLIIFLFINTQNNFKYIFKALIINLLFSLIGSVLGYLIAYFFVSIENSGVWMDFGTNNPKNYIEAVYMHEGSYYGGIVGLLFGIIYLVLQNNKYKNLKKNVA